MDIGLQTISTSIRKLIAQTDIATPKEPGKTTQLLEWFNQIPGLGWGLAIFALIAIAVTAVAKLIDGLDEIFSFRLKYFSQQDIELPEQQLSFKRRQLLKVMRIYISQRLEDSLHQLTRIDLEKEEKLRQVGRSRERLVPADKQTIELAESLNQRNLAIFKESRDIASVDSAVHTYSILNRNDIGGRLLILGEPGAGKTTELLAVAQKALEEAIEDDNKPIPLIFELSSWVEKEAIFDWLVRRLAQRYGIHRKLGRKLIGQWIQRDQILPCLDGLDELDPRSQIGCIEALEKFLKQNSALSTIVCCRRADYEQGQKQLKQLNGAIYLKPISLDKIHQYLKTLDRGSLWTAIQANPELLELAQLPLFLTMLVVAYQGKPIRDREALFNAYIQKQLRNPIHKGTYKKGKSITPSGTINYLIWLATYLEQRKETEFLIKDLQLPWQSTTIQQKRVYRLVIGLLFGPFGGVLGWRLFGPFGGLLGWLLFGLIGSEFDIEKRERSTEDIGILSRSLISGSLIGLFGGLGTLFSEGLYHVRHDGLIAGILHGLTYGLLALVSGILLGTLFTFLLLGLLNTIGYVLFYGLLPAIQTLATRMALTMNNDAPWNYALFLKHATKHRFIQNNGRRYRFIHDLLRKHFAQMNS